LEAVLTSILRTSSDLQRNQQHSNAQQAVLFEAINLAIGMANSSLLAQCTELLISFISGKETNTRYLGLEAMCHLAIYSESLDVMKDCYDSVIEALNDRDTSVRRRAVDLLYVMCDSSNATNILGELLKSLATSDFSMREEMVLKIAILAEQHTPDPAQYVDTMLQLIVHGGDQVNEDVWYRIVQVVVNNEAVQTYGTHNATETLRSPSCPETAVKVAAYLLGEFAHYITEKPNCSPMQLLVTLHSKFQIATLPTRALLLTTYVKFVNLFPEIKPEILDIFRQLTHALDSELQQRACEYYALCTMANDDLLQSVCDEMPKFSERKSALLSKLQKKEADTEDKRTWKVLEKDTTKPRIKAITLPITTGASHPPPSPSPTQKVTETIDLLGLDDPLPAPSMPTSPLALMSPFSPNTDLTALFVRKIIINNDGILFEDATLQIGVKSEYHGPLGRLALYIGNKTINTLNSFSISLKPCPELNIACIQNIVPTLQPHSQVQQIYNIECLTLFNSPPTLTVSYSTIFQPGLPIQFTLPFPVLISKFSEPITMNKADFVTRWQQIGGPPKETQTTFTPSRDFSRDEVLSFIKGYGCGICEGVDPNPNNYVFASIITTSSSGKVGILFRLEVDPVSKVGV
jgi:AP-2 complex subunit alpha